MFKFCGKSPARVPKPSLSFVMTLTVSMPLASICSINSLLPAIATCIFIPLAVSLAVKVSSGSLLITQGATASATFRATNVAVSNFSLAPTNNSVSTCIAAEPTEPGAEPSMTNNSSLSLVGGQAPPGQCITKVFLPASTKQFQTGSVVTIRESTL